jgi:hypothetical protein
MCCVEVWVADHDSLQSAFGVYEVYCCLVDEGDEIPENISCPSLDEDCALADAELLPVSKVGFGGDVVDADIMFVRCAFIVLLVGFLG